MANSIPSAVKIEIDSTAGGSLADISQYVTHINGISVEQLMEQTDSFGDSWEESLPVGKGKVAPIVLGGLFDDTASTGPDAIFKITTPDTPATASRTFKITFITSGKNVSVETFRQKYDRSADRSGITKYEATLMPTGATTEA